MSNMYVDGKLVEMTPEQIADLRSVQTEEDLQSPLRQNLTKRQINAALIQWGQVSPESFVEQAIAAIAEPTQRALALNDWRNAPFYKRSHPLFSEANMLAAIGMTDKDVNALWSLAAQQPR